MKVDRKIPNDNVFSHIATCAEDGQVILWDTRFITKDGKEIPKEKWDPFLKIQLYRTDGSGEMGLTRLLFKKD